MISICILQGIPPATAASIRAEDQDKLSDIIPNSADLSRQVSISRAFIARMTTVKQNLETDRQPSTRPVSEGDDEIPEVIGDDEGEEELDEPEDEDVDMEGAVRVTAAFALSWSLAQPRIHAQSTSPPEAGPSKPKTPSALAREAQKMERKTHRAAEQAKRKVNEGKLSARRREVSGQKVGFSSVLSTISPCGSVKHAGYFHTAGGLYQAILLPPRSDRSLPTLLRPQETEGAGIRKVVGGERKC